MLFTSLLVDIFLTGVNILRNILWESTFQKGVNDYPFYAQMGMKNGC